MHTYSNSAQKEWCITSLYSIMDQIFKLSLKNAIEWHITSLYSVIHHIFKLSLKKQEWCIVEWSGVDWSGLDWTRTEWSGLDWTRLEWSGVDFSPNICILGRVHWSPYGLWGSAKYCNLSITLFHTFYRYLDLLLTIPSFIILNHILSRYQLINIVCYPWLSFRILNYILSRPYPKDLISLWV